MALDSIQSVIALDYGDARIGVAIASHSARLARPLTTLSNDDQFMSKLKDLIVQENVDTIIVGYPRGQDGQATAQSEIVEEFIDKLKDLGLKIVSQDESLTSVHAEAELTTRGTQYTKADIDALAATYILEDYLNANEG